MAKWYQGYFKPEHPEKYKGDTSQIVYRSSWELKCFRDLDRSPSVLAWGAEPFAIKYYDPVKEKERRYFPDLWCQVKKRDGIVETWVVEIKPYHETQAPVQKKGKRRKTLLKETMTFMTNNAKWKAARAACAARGWKFMLLTDKQASF